MKLLKYFIEKKREKKFETFLNKKIISELYSIGIEIKNPNYKIIIKIKKISYENIIYEKKYKLKLYNIAYVMKSNYVNINLFSENLKKEIKNYFRYKKLKRIKNY